MTFIHLIPFAFQLIRWIL